ncbi:hypothetical protein C0992_004780 [Termitomyces sp. T32_za158]|nr:hypothetical protein C0992_004780 [Termitomyces sp. T32_za158]
MPYFPGLAGPGGQPMGAQVMWGMPMPMPQASAQTASTQLSSKTTLTASQIAPMEVDEDTSVQRLRGRGEMAAPRQAWDRMPPAWEMHRRERRWLPPRVTTTRGRAPHEAIGHRHDEPAPQPPAPLPQRIPYKDKGKGKEVGTAVLDSQSEAMWRWLITAGQHVPPESAFLADSVAQVVISGLLDEIVMLQQHNKNMIKAFTNALKRCPSPPHEIVEAKHLKVADTRGVQSSEERVRREASREPPWQRKAGEVTPTPSELYDELVDVDASLQGLASSAHAPAPKKGAAGVSEEIELMSVEFAKDVLRGADRSDLKFGPVVQFEAPLKEYKPAVLKQDMRSEDDVEGRLPMFALLGLEDASDMSNYGEQPEDTPSKDETPANHRLQLAHNKEMAARSKHEAARIAKADKDREEQATGHIPDGLGVFVNGMVIEWSNWFFGGVLDCHFYYSCFTNTIFMSDEAIAVKAFKDKRGERYYHTSRNL